jgi:hypothetical protein
LRRRQSRFVPESDVYCESLKSAGRIAWSPVDLGHPLVMDGLQIERFSASRVE